MFTCIYFFNGLTHFDNHIINIYKFCRITISFISFTIRTGIVFFIIHFIAIRFFSCKIFLSPRRYAGICRNISTCLRQELNPFVVESLSGISIYIYSTVQYVSFSSFGSFFSFLSAFTTHRISIDLIRTQRTALALGSIRLIITIVMCIVHCFRLNDKY